MYYRNKDYGIHIASESEEKELEKQGYVPFPNYEEWVRNGKKKVIENEKSIDKQEDVVTIQEQAEPQKRSPGRPKK